MNADPGHCRQAVCDPEPQEGSAAGSGQWPLISIVTPSYNQGQFLEETITSILAQGYPRLQYVVIDGGSTDNSVATIRRYADRIDFWVSERDRGQSCAINKGLARCTGDLFNWINSDDMLAPGALWEIARAWRGQPGRIVAGHTEWFNAAGPFELLKASGQTLRNFVRFWEAEGWGWAQPSTFVPLAELKAIGGVREDLKYCFDYHMMVRLLARELEVVYIDRPLARFRFNEDSKTVGAKEEFRLERIDMLRAERQSGITVAPWEWDREQARRFLDVGWHALRACRMRLGLRLCARAVRTSPRGAWLELSARLRRRLRLSGRA